MRALKLAPDFAGPVEFGFQHRKIGERDIYLVSSGSDRSFCGTVSFRVTGVAPELWDPATGETVPAPVWETQGGRTAVQLQLPAERIGFCRFLPGSREEEPSAAAGSAGFRPGSKSLKRSTASAMQRRAARR